MMFEHMPRESGDSSTNEPPTLLVVLTRDSDPSRVATDLPAFLRFSDEVTFGLEELVSRWESSAAPLSRIGIIQRLPPQAAT